MNREKNNRWARGAVGSIVLALLMSAGAAGSPLTAGDMFVNRWEIPAADYVFTYRPATSYTANFADVTRLQVLPAYSRDDTTPFRTATVDYTGDITGTTGSITFLQPGPYMVRATHTDSTVSYYDIGVGFNIHPNQTGPTHTWTEAPVPENATIILDPNDYVDRNGQTRNLKPSEPDTPASSALINTFTTWDEVVAYMKRQTNAHIELGGHGGPGAFYWNGVRVLDESAASAALLNELRGHVSNLTFMSCYTGSSVTFLKLVASTLGSASGYTTAVAGDGTYWYVADGGTYVTIPAGPGVLVLLAGMAFSTRRRVA